jgi:hypothetical protein
MAVLRVRPAVVLRVPLDVVAAVGVPVVAVRVKMVAAVVPHRVPMGCLLAVLEKVLDVPVDVPLVL